MYVLTCAVLMALLTLAVIVRCGVWSLPSFASLIFTIGFGVRAVIIATSDSRLVFRRLFVSPEQTQGWVFAGLLVFLAMCLGFVIAARVVTGPARVAGEGEALPAYRSGVVLAGAWTAIALQYWLLARSFGGGAAAIVAISQRTFTGESTALASNLTPGAMGLLVFAMVLARRERRRWFARFAAATFLFALPWVTIVNGRASAVVLLWTLFLVLQAEIGVPPRLRALVGTAVAVVAAAVIGLAWRQTAQSGQPFGRSLADAWGQAGTAVSDALPLFDQVAVAMEYANVAGHDAAASLLDGLTVLVPRAVWPGKPEFMPQVVGEVVGQSSLSGLPVGLVGEGYIAFGWLGASMYALVLGFALMAAHRRTRLGRPRSPMSTFVVFVMVSVTMAALRTGPQGALISLQVFAVSVPIVVAVSAVAKRTSPTKRPATRLTWGRPVLR